MSADIVDMFHSFRTILCVCPHCNGLLRLSDLHLKYGGKAPRTWLDKYDANKSQIDNMETEFDEKEDKLREAAHERARKQVPKLVNKFIDRRIAQLKYNPYDIKTIMHPVDFVVFNGLNTNDEIENITFLSEKTQNQTLNKIRKSLFSSVDKERYDWKTARIQLDGNIQLE